MSLSGPGGAEWGKGREVGLFQECWMRLAELDGEVGWVDEWLVDCGFAKR